MPFRIDIFPEAKLVIKTFWGSLSLEESRKAHEELINRKDFEPAKFNGLNDCRRAIKTYSIDEAKPYFEKLNEIPDTTRWCALENKPRDTALALLYLKTTNDSSNRNVFSTIPAVAEFLLTPDISLYLEEISKLVD